MDIKHNYIKKIQLHCKIILISSSEKGLNAKRRMYLMEAKVVPDGVRAEEDVSLSCHHQDEAVQCLQRQKSC